MPPDSQAVELIAIAAAVLAPVALALTWSRARRWWRIPIRAVGVLACVLTAVAAGAFWVNRQIEAYTTWSRLFGSSTEAAHRPVTTASRDGGRMITLTVAGPRSDITMPMYAYLPPGYDAHQAMRYPVIEAFHGAPGGPLFWITKLAAPAVLDREITAHRMAPTVVLFPYQTPDPALDTECTDMVGGPRAETYLTVDVPAFAASHLHVRTDPGSWA